MKKTQRERNLNPTLVSTGEGVAPTFDCLTERQIYVTQDANPLQTPRVYPHRVQNFLTIATRSRIVVWRFQTADTEGEFILPSETVPKFPDCLRGTEKAKIMRVGRPWDEYTRYEDMHDENMQDWAPYSITRVTKKGLNSVRLKVRSGCGRRRAVWVEALHAE